MLAPWLWAWVPCLAVPFFCFQHAHGMRHPWWVFLTVPMPHAHSPTPRCYCLNCSLFSTLDCHHKPPMTSLAQPAQPSAIALTSSIPWGQIAVATAICVALQPPFLAYYTEMLPLLSSSCWINLVNSSWPEVVRSYLSAWCFWVGYTQWHSWLQTLRLLNDILSIRCKAVS